MNPHLYSILSASIEFCHKFEKDYYTFLKTAGFKQRNRKSRLELAEILTRESPIGIETKKAAQAT